MTTYKDDWLYKYQNSLMFKIRYMGWTSHPLSIKQELLISHITPKTVHVFTPSTQLVNPNMWSLKMISTNIVNSDTVARVRRVGQNLAALLDIHESSTGRPNRGAMMNSLSIGEGHGAKVGKGN